MHSFELEYFEKSSDAFLLCRKRNGEDSLFEVTWVNSQAKSVLGWIAEFPTPFPIEQHIPSAVLQKALVQANTSSQKQSGLLVGLPAADLESPLAFEVTPLSSTLLVLVKKELQNKLLIQALGDQLLSTHLTGVVALDALRNQEGLIEDFSLTFQNQDPRNYPFLGILGKEGECLNDWVNQPKEVSQFSHFVKVVETGTPYVPEKYYSEKDQTFQLAVTKYGDGVLVNYYDRTAKQQVERKLELQSQVLQQLIDCSQDIIVLWEPVRDAEENIIDLKASQFNKAALCEGFFSAEDYQKGTLTQMSTGAKEFIPQYAQVLQTGIPLRVERHNRREGKDLWTDVSVNKLEDKLLMFVRDITQQKLATLEVEEQNLLLENILNSTENYKLVAEAIRDESGCVIDFRITKGNNGTIHTLQSLFGFNTIGYSIRQLVGKKAKLFEQAIQVMETGLPYIKDRWHNRITDSWYKFTMHKLNNGVVITYVDITAIQKALLNVQHQKELVEGVLDSSINGILAMEVIKDGQGQIEDFKIVLANQAAETYTFLTNAEIVGKTYLSLFPTAREVGYFARMKQAVEASVPFRAEVSFPSPKLNTIRWFTLSLTQTGKGLVILTFMETTDQVLLRQNQELLLEELRQSNKDLEQFAYIASHDLQEPARKISSFSKMVVKQFTPLLPPAGIDLLNRMQSASIRMQDLIDGLLTYSQFSTQKESHQPVSLHALVQNILSDLESRIEEKKAHILLAELPDTEGNAIQLRQLFQNLISNALKFSHTDIPPQICIESGVATQEEIIQSGLDIGSCFLAVRVKDNGIGMEQDHGRRIFELFVRLQGRSHYPGSGLGLSICKKVAELHGGGITVTSTPGAGSTFVVLLPSPH
ncbi:PAS domain-containing sensor histidine kinase [Telluribacter sp.]|jgi:signal transduction histidine kinase|uniref:PAS domain-containing sensor histidine kinase n=1 Tax=Telluribacter sp. TaxID=1978767 RepID=UPI002E0F5F48|nr:ATP-binding protein [Telluribacter sp.]